MPFITPQDILDKDFFELLGLPNMDPAKKTALLVEMGKTIHATVYAAIYQQLSDEERGELDSIPEENILPYLTEKGFDVPGMIFDEAQRYKVEVLATFSQAVQDIPALTQKDA